MSETTEPKPKKTREISDKQRAANQANSRMSTGPTTSAGKARSSRNGTVHGLRSQQIILSNEDPGVFDQRRHAFHATYQPGDAIEAKLVDDFVVASWRLDRCLGADTACLDKRVVESFEIFDLDADDHFHALVRNLSSDPPHVARQLRGCAAGTAWAVAFLEAAVEAIQQRGFWYCYERDQVLNIFGLCTEDIFRDGLAYDIVRAFVGAGWSTGGDILRVQALIRTPAPANMAVWEYRHRVDGLADVTRDADPAESRGKLVAILTSEIERLKKRLILLRDRDDRVRARTAQRASVDTSAEGQTRIRYEAMHRRAYRHALGDLMDYRKSRGEKEIDPYASINGESRTALSVAPTEAISTPSDPPAAEENTGRPGLLLGENGEIPATLGASIYAKGALGGEVAPDRSPLDAEFPTPEGIRQFVKEVEAVMGEFDYETGATLT